MRRSRYRVLAVGLLLASLAFAFFYPAHRLSFTQSTGPFSGYRGWTHSAPSTSGFVSTWEDGRFGSPHYKAFAARITDPGVNLDPAGLRLSPASYYQWDPTVSCVGDLCLLAWQQSSSGIFGRTLNASTGTLGNVFQITPAGQACVAPEIGNDGARFLVAYQSDPSMNGVVMGRFVSTAGVNQGAPVQLSTINGGLPTLSFGGGNYLVVITDSWSATGRVFSHVVNSTGISLTAEIQLGTLQDKYWPAVGAWTTLGFVVVWSDTFSDLKARRLTPTGVAVDANPVPVLVAAAIRKQPTIVFDGNAVAVLWVEGDFELHGLRTDSTLSIVTPDVVLVPRGPKAIQGPRLSLFARNRSLLSWWNDDYRTPIQFHSNFLASSGAGLSLSTAGEIVQTIPDLHDWPVAAPLGDGFAVGFGSNVGGSVNNLVQPIDAVGVPQGAPISLGSGGAQLFGPALHAANGVTRAAWYEGGSVLTATITPQGGRTAAQTLGTGFNWAGTPTMASLGGRTLVAWAGETATSDALYTRFIESDGGISPGTFTTLPLSPVNFPWFTHPKLAANSANFGLVFLDGKAAKFTRLSAISTVLDGTGIALAPQAENVSIACDATDYFAVWASDQPGEVKGRRINGINSTFLDANTIDVAGATNAAGFTNNSADPQVIFDGIDYVVGWSMPTEDGGSIDIETARVDFISAAVRNVTSVAGNGSSEHQRVALAVGTQGQTLHAWLEPDFIEGSLRVNGVVSAPTAVDAGTQVDAGVPDAGALDSGVPDAGAPDSGVVDAGTLDAGADSGVMDSGISDSGINDAGPGDSGISDAGLDASVPDASVADAGPLDLDAGTDGGIDAGTDTDAGPRVVAYTVGCGCQSPSGAPWGLAVLLALALRRRRVS